MSYKQFDLANDVAVLTTAINEVLVISGSIFSTANNVKYYKNIASGTAGTDLGGYFQTVYDAAPSSSVSSPLFDVTYGYATGSSYNVAPTTTSSQTEKIKIYRQFASVLLGDPDAVFSINSTDRKEALFIAFKRNITKDEIKKGSVSVVFNNQTVGILQYSGSDTGASNAFQQKIGGDYAPLKYRGTGSEVGQVWYNAGVVVIHPDSVYGAITLWSGSVSLINCQYSGTINQIVDGFRSKTDVIALNNQVNLQSTTYFCRAYNNEFNYSSNPTFINDEQRIRVTSGSNITTTRTYVTTIGLYDENDGLLASGKVNKPVLKSPDSECIFRIRLDY